jgi:hypothetical protein
LEKLYEYYLTDFIKSRTTFNGQRVGTRRHPQVKGKDAGFWHIISEGKEEEERTPDMRRCERIRWPKPVIQECFNRELRIWKTERGSDKRMLISLNDFSYLVVIAMRKDYLLLITAFRIEREHRRRKMEREYIDFVKKADTALSDDTRTPPAHGG